MAKKNTKIAPLTLQEIILRGEADIIRQALEARVQIDTLLEEREAAYRRISELEVQVENIVGVEGVFPFPQPPVPVASFDIKAAPKKPAAPKPAKPIEKPTPISIAAEDNSQQPADEAEPTTTDSSESSESSDETSSEDKA